MLIYVILYCKRKKSVRKFLEMENMHWEINVLSCTQLSSFKYLFIFVNNSMLNCTIYSPLSY